MLLIKNFIIVLLKLQKELNCSTFDSNITPSQLKHHLDNANSNLRELTRMSFDPNTETKWWNGKRQIFKDPGDYILADGVDSDCKKKMKALLSKMAKKQYYPLKD